MCTSTSHHVTRVIGTYNMHMYVHTKHINFTCNIDAVQIEIFEGRNFEILSTLKNEYVSSTASTLLE